MQKTFQDTFAAYKASSWALTLRGHFGVGYIMADKWSS